MNTPPNHTLPDPNAAGYNVDYIRRSRWRSLGRVGLRLFLVLMLASALGSGALFFLAELPRERSEAKLPFFERARLGGLDMTKALYSSITVPEIAKGVSQLPVIEVRISGTNLDKLNSNLPTSGATFQSGWLRVVEPGSTKSKIFRAKVRYRGDSMNHWAFPEKSWRIRLSRGKVYRDRRLFNLYLPRLSSKVADYLGYHLGSEFGLHSPDAFPVHFRLNRKFDGVRMYLEQVDQAFLARRGLEPSEIFIGDIDSSQIYGNKKRAFLFRDIDAWEINPPNLDKGTADTENKERDPLRHLSSLLFRKRSMTETSDRLHEVLDVESAIRYTAMLELVGSTHVDDNHNQKWYLNTQVGALQPIVWDTVAYYHNNLSKLDRPNNQLMRVLLLIPHLRDKKNKILWDAINSFASTENLVSYVQQEEKRIAPDVLADPFKLVAESRAISLLSNDEWRKGVASLVATIKQRNEFLRRELAAKQASFLVNGDRFSRSLVIFPEAPSSLLLQKISLPITENSAATKVELVRVGVSEQIGNCNQSLITTQGKIRDGVVSFDMGDTLSPHGTPPSNLELATKQSRYEFAIRVQGPGWLGDEVTLTGINQTTGGAYKSSDFSRLANESSKKDTLPGWWQPEIFMTQSTVQWSGLVEIKRDLILERYQDLEIAPGTTIKIAPQASVVVRGGNLIARGTKERPIRIESLDQQRPFGVIGIRGLGAPGTLAANVTTDSSALPRVIISNVILQGGSQSRAGYTYFSSPLSVHNANIQISESTFDGANIRIANSVGTLSNIEFRNVVREPVLIENSRLEQNRIVKDIRDPRHLISYADGAAVGTAPRAEREYRFSVKPRPGPHESSGGQKELESETLANAAKVALEAAVLDRTRWRAEQFALGTYRTSTAVGEAVYRDIYIDTPELFNRDHHISYRLRNRFADKRTHDAHIRHPRVPDYWPYRIEFQGKTGRLRGDNDLTTVTEARLEFRKQSKPFSDDFLPPPPPWPIPDYLQTMLEGRLFGMVTSPAKLVMQAYRDLGFSGQEVKFVPMVAVATTRRRQHLEIRTPWGSGPNPDQAYIITVDDSHIFATDPYLEAIQAGWRGEEPKIPERASRLLELEIEFERNVSDALDRAIDEAEALGDKTELARLEAARQSFMDDLSTIVTLINERLAPLGFELTPVFESKYRQSLAAIGK